MLYHVKEYSKGCERGFKVSSWRDYRCQSRLASGLWHGRLVLIVRATCPEIQLSPFLGVQQSIRGHRLLTIERRISHIFNV